MEQLLGQRRRSRDLPGADQDRGASATNDAHVTEVESPHVHEILQTTDNDSDDHVIETILFQNHLGKTYIWPLRLCQSLEAVKSLILEAYAHDTWHSQQIINEQYDIENEDGAIILPSVWKTFLKPSAKVRISFRKELVSQQMPLSTQASGRSEVLISDAGDQDDTQNVELEAQTTSILDHAQISRAATSTSSDRDRDWVRYRSETRRVVPDPNLASSESDGEDDSTSSEHNGNVFSTDEEDLEPPRTVVPAVDDKGNRLSFGIDTSRARQRPYVQREVATKEEDSATSKHGHEIKEQSFKELRITKAMLGGTDTKTIMQVHILPGPDNPQLRGNVKTTWYHLQATQLDLTRFKETCIGIEGLTSRLQMLTREVFGRVEKRRVKKALYGYSVEPGTVVRADERRQDKPEAVIFSCIPYLDLQSLEKQAPVSSGTTPLLFPPRTLMQAMYPLWSVQDRDREQAYRKFGNEHNNKAVHLSDMWMVNIGADMVVTHGHRALADEMVNSIEVVKEDLRQLGSNDITRTSLTTVRITHRDSRVRLYTLDACRSYFQLESKLNRMKTVSCNSKIGDDLRVLYSFVEGRRVVAPNDWTAIVKRTDLMFIDLEEIEQDETSSTGNDLKLDASNAIGNSVPPFFRWPSTTSATNISNQGNPKNNPTADMEREAQRLEYAERIMLNEYLDSLFAYNDVEKSFTSTKYYRYLPETTHEHFVTRLESLLFEPERGTHLSFHATVIAEQRTCVATKSKSFYNIVQDTLRLFVSDLDGSATLRKLWCTMSNISDWVDQVLKLDGAAPGLAGGLAVNANDRCASTMGWYIRNDKLRSMALPNADKVFIRLLRHCRQCTSSRPFESAKSAIDHLETHWRPQMPGTHNNDCPPSDPNIPPSKDGGGLKLSDWIVEAKHLEQEKINAGGVKILTQSCEDASKLFQQIKELAEGIRNEDKEPSQLYTFPRQLVGAFHKLVVFYIGVERALWYTKASDQDIEDPRLLRGFPRQSVSMDILRTLKRFAKGVETSVSLARNQLCDMVKPDSTPDAMQNMSLGSEYVCAWFMRRLLVKPLESGLSTGDMYRKYLTNIQLQVNQHPSKRVIRSINLLQEELQALVEVNKWQRKVVKDYSNVLDDKSYEKDIPSRCAMFPYERNLLQSCSDCLNMAHRSYQDMIERCIPLSNQAKQSLEIYEEDHGKAITAFTVVTVIFLPLSFVTSYLGMNTIDIRDMASGQSLFWAIALPLTFITIGCTMFIGYNGDVLRDFISDLYHQVTGKQDGSTYAHGNRILRSRPTRLQDDSRRNFNTSMTDRSEYMKPQRALLTCGIGGDDLGPYVDEWDDRVISNRNRRRLRRRLNTDEPLEELTWTRKNTDRLPRKVGLKV